MTCNAKDPSSFDIARRIVGYAVDRLTITEPVLSAVGVGTTAVGIIAALEGSLHLQPQTQSVLTKCRFTLRYAAYNIIPSLIWATQSPTALIASSSYLSQQMKPTNEWIHQTLPPQRALFSRILCALRGAVAGSVVLSNVIVLTSLWQRANEDYTERIRMGKEPPLASSNSCTIRLAGARSDVTELSLRRRGPRHLWPVYEDASLVQPIVSRFANNLPIYWQVNDCQYSKESSWNRMKVPTTWLFSVRGERILYLEADATAGDESALSLQHGSLIALGDKDTDHAGAQRWKWDRVRQSNGTQTALAFLGMNTNTRFSDLDLDLKEVAQGFRHLKNLAEQGCTGVVRVRRVLLVDPTVVLESGGGRQTSVRERIEELGLADVIVDARASVLYAILAWLEDVQRNDNSYTTKVPSQQERPVILETPSKVWFQSIRTELRRHGYKVIDRSEASSLKTSPPMLVYERSSADTINTIRQYLERGIANDRVCALVTCHDGLDEVDALNRELDNKTVGCVCSSDIHDRAFEWVKTKSMAGISADEIQRELDSGAAWKS